MRYIVTAVLALALVFAVSTASLASPLTAADEGQLQLFVDYGTYIPMQLSVGMGYGFTNGFTVGAQYSFYGPGFIGAYANLTADPIVIKGDFFFWPEFYGRAAGYFTFGPDPITLGLGGGAVFNSYDVVFFVSGAVSIGTGSAFGLYGSVDYYPAFGYAEYEAGLSIGF